MLTSLPNSNKLAQLLTRGVSNHGLQDRGQGCLSEPRRWDHRTDQLRDIERPHGKVLHAEDLRKWPQGHGSGKQRNFGRLAASHSQRRKAQSSWVPRKRETEFTSPPPEIPLQKQGKTPWSSHSRKPVCRCRRHWKNQKASSSNFSIFHP